MLVTTMTALLVQNKLPEPVTSAAIAVAGTLVFGLCCFVVGRYFAPLDGKPKQPAWDSVAQSPYGAANLYRVLKYKVTADAFHRAARICSGPAIV